MWNHMMEMGSNGHGPQDNLRDGRRHDGPMMGMDPNQMQELTEEQI